jgi:hypothetical protein
VTSRKQIFAALFALATEPGPSAFQTTGRIAKHWSDVSPADQPAFYQLEGKQVGVTIPRTPTKWTFHAEWLIYAHSKNTIGGDALVDLLNDLIDAAVALVTPTPGRETQTLGELVTDVRLDGTIELSNGLLGDQAVAILPLIIIANA